MRHRVSRWRCICRSHRVQTVALCFLNPVGQGNRTGFGGLFPCIMHAGCFCVWDRDRRRWQVKNSYDLGKMNFRATMYLFSTTAGKG